MSLTFRGPLRAALLGVASTTAALLGAPAGAQPVPVAIEAATAFTLDQALAAVGASSPASAVASAGIDAAKADRTTAGLRPNPTVQAQVENIGGRGPYKGLRSAETTLGVNIPIELGGKRSARVAVANARVSRAELQAAVATADVTLQVTQLYIDAVAAERRVEIAREQQQIAGDAANVASQRVQAGRASPIEEQRAGVAKVNADATLEQAQRLASTARSNLSRRIAMAVPATLDGSWLERTPLAGAPPIPAVASEDTLTLAVADADLDIADAGVRLARANRVPDLTIGPAYRRLEQTNDNLAVFSVSIPLPIYNNGRSAIASAAAERSRAAAQLRLTAQDVDQAIADAETEAANAAVLARAATGPALAAAQEAARIARIGYREGKFGQLELLDAERTLAQTRSAAIDALVGYHTAVARLDRLTTPAPR